MVAILSAKTLHFLHFPGGECRKYWELVSRKIDEISFNKRRAVWLQIFYSNCLSQSPLSIWKHRACLAKRLDGPSVGWNYWSRKVLLSARKFLVVCRTYTWCPANSTQVWPLGGRGGLSVVHLYATVCCKGLVKVRKFGAFPLGAKVTPGMKKTLCRQKARDDPDDYI